MDIKGKKVSVIGAGKSGLAAAELLVRKGAEAFVSELRRIGEKGVLLLQEMQIPYEEEGHSERVYDADFCVISPGIPPSAPIVQGMQARAIPLYSEIEIASLFCQARIVGITGTDGKTTTSTIVHRICEEDGLRRGYRSFCVGNIGVPFSSMVMEMSPDDVAVVELSSYQLERSPAFRPDVSIITNITPDHLDRYSGDMQCYAAAKFRIYANQRPEDTLVYNADDPLLHAHFTADNAQFPFRIFSFGMESVGKGEIDRRTVLLDGECIIVRTSHGDERIMETSEFLKKSFRGRHNISNVLAAVGVARALGIGDEPLLSALRSFLGVEHRQELVLSINGVDWVNDSKATNLNAMRQALQSLPATAVLIAGGRDKGNDYATIAELVKEKITLLIAIGESRGKIVGAFDGMVPLKAASSLEEAILMASEAALPGQSVLFSPGCASFDMFDNFEERGRQFKQCVHRLLLC
ncbi:MAG: UDP-N-acetylmuramoyl-L-alanine--D-glutamate ligase [Chlorobium sp.]|nr:MAG: UDP-N-acetylmuramoyl-L-alanine--D-glutamate ligase [Chlorobium sp.]